MGEKPARTFQDEIQFMSSSKTRRPKTCWPQCDGPIILAKKRAAATRRVADPQTCFPAPNFPWLG